MMTGNVCRLEKGSPQRTDLDSCAIGYGQLGGPHRNHGSFASSDLASS
jgi:hypothetical protein